VKDGHGRKRSVNVGCGQASVTLPVESPACEEHSHNAKGFFKMASKKDDDSYTLKLTGPGVTIDRTVAEDVATKIITFVMGGGELAPRSGGSGGGGNGSDISIKIDRSSGGQLTPKQFVAQRKPGNDYERVACLGYYLASQRNTPHFKTSDITKLATESAHSISNPGRAVMHATSAYRYLTKAGGGKKQMTPLGEAVVEALPDRAAVAAAIAENRPNRRAKRKTAKK
jgi:hypothetical protein